MSQLSRKKRRSLTSKLRKYGSMPIKIFKKFLMISHCMRMVNLRLGMCMFWRKLSWIFMLIRIRKKIPSSIRLTICWKICIRRIRGMCFRSMLMILKRSTGRKSRKYWLTCSWRWTMAKRSLLKKRNSETTPNN